MNRQKIIKFQLFPFLITILLFSSFMAPSALENEQQTLRKTAILNQSENSSYGLLQGNHLMEKQIISTDYPSSVRYTHPSVSLTKTLGNNESQEYHSSSSSPYSEFRYYDSYEDKRTTLPSHVIAKNLTDNIPTLNLTTYIEFMGLLDLDDRTIVFAKKDVLYAYTIILPEGNYYDLNIRTTEDTNFYISQDKVFVNSFIVDGKTRSLQRLFPYKGMNLTLYFYSASESYIIFEPINLKPKELALNQPYFE